MEKIFIQLLLTFVTCNLFAQRIVPAPAQSKPIIIRGGTVHVGNGQVIDNCTILIQDGKIVSLTTNDPNVAGDFISINAKGKQIYPGLIAPNTQLGLVEIEAARATNDQYEVGTYNPGVRSLIAYNTDSKAIPTVRSNGILIAESVPLGGIITGTSSIMQLDAWNWEDAAYKSDNAIHMNWPSFFSYKQDDNGAMVTNNADYEKQVTEIRQYFTQAQSYNQLATHTARNINFEAMKGVVDGSKKLVVHCDYVREIINAVQFAKDYNVKLVIMGGSDAYLCTDILKQNNVAVILGNVHSLPNNDDDEVKMPYRTADLLNKAGITYCLSIYGFWQTRNLPFMAGTTTVYGVSKEDALKSITSSTAKILGIDDRTGTLEAGKDANIIISSGDILDMMTSNIEHAFIQGREINLDNSQKQLYEIYKAKYGLK
ncbi:MAG: amidohydrolase family protein [Chitinophagales bacterium]|nr:amidohydrolase family protein [Chitinophagales bacterium]